MSAWRPIQALDTRLASAKAAISRYSSGLRFTERRCVDGIAKRREAGCTSGVHGAAPRCSLQGEARSVNSGSGAKAADGSLSGPHGSTRREEIRFVYREEST